MRVEEFKRLMLAVAEAWSDGKVEKAADHYTEQGLFEFCGNRRPRPPIRIVWDHLSFDEHQQVGYGEYRYQRIGVGDRSAQINYKYRAIAIVKVNAGKICNWQECRG